MVDAWSCEAGHGRFILNCVACRVMTGSASRLHQGEDLNCTIRPIDKSRLPAHLCDSRCLLSRPRPCLAERT